MPTLPLQEDFTDWVDAHVLPLFNDLGLEITQNARNLIAFAMQSQVEEHRIDQDDLFDRAERITSEELVDYYIQTYGERRVNFNRAFRLLNDVGIVLCFPFSPTQPANAAVSEGLRDRDR